MTESDIEIADAFDSRSWWRGASVNDVTWRPTEAPPPRPSHTHIYIYIFFFVVFCPLFPKRWVKKLFLSSLLIELREKPAKKKWQKRGVFGWRSMNGGDRPNNNKAEYAIGYVTLNWLSLWTFLADCWVDCYLWGRRIRIAELRVTGHGGHILHRWPVFSQGGNKRKRRVKPRRATNSNQTLTQSNKKNQIDWWNENMGHCSSRLSCANLSLQQWTGHATDNDQIFFVNWNGRGVI